MCSQQHFHVLMRAVMQMARRHKLVAHGQQEACQIRICQGADKRYCSAVYIASVYKFMYNGVCACITMSYLCVSSSCIYVAAVFPLGDYFGELSIIKNDVRRANVIAK